MSEVTPLQLDLLLAHCNGVGVTVHCNGVGVTVHCNGVGVTVHCNGVGVTVRVELPLGASDSLHAHHGATRQVDK